MRRIAVLVVALVVVVAAGVLLVVLPGEQETSPAIRLDFDDGVPTSDGTVPVEVEIVSQDGGAVTWESAAGGDGQAMRLPGRGSGSRVAVVSIRGTGEVDELSPGLRDFRLRVDVLVDAGEDTDGENVVQRGLADDLGQIKIELDGGAIRCTVKGTDGRVTAEVDSVVVPGVWYRMECGRSGGTVTMTATRLDSGAAESASSTGAIGEVRTELATTPMSVGGKLTPRNAIASWQPDQLNGAVDNVVLTID